MSTTKQEIYTGALTSIGHRKYLTTENTEAIRVLDDHYDEVIRECLENGMWNHSAVFAKLDGDTGLISYGADTGSVGTGYRYGFTKPAGWARTQRISDDEHFTYPLQNFDDRGSILAADINKIFLLYNDTGLGLDLTRWPKRFARYVQLELGLRIAYRLTSSKDVVEHVTKARDKAKTSALNQDAQDEEQPRFAPPGSWSRSRWGRFGAYERGNKSNLYG